MQLTDKLHWELNPGPSGWKPSELPQSQAPTPLVGTKEWLVSYMVDLLASSVGKWFGWLFSWVGWLVG